MHRGKSDGLSETAILTVGDLRKALETLPDSLLVVVSGYESGFTKPTIRRAPLKWVGENTDLPYVFGEWKEPWAWDERDDRVHDALILER